jgi:hypothetical protein
MEKILTSTDKIASRGRKIEDLDLEDGQPKAIAANGAVIAPELRPVAGAAE